MKQGWIQVTSNNTQEALAPKTMADMVYMDNPQSESVKDAILYHTPIHFQAEFLANGWSASAPYTQTIQVTGLLSTDIPLGDVVLSSTPATAAQELQAYGHIGRMDTGAGQLTACCYTTKPDVDLPILLKVVR